ncbi:MAG: YdeI/OmpD-associated family protein [Eubacteriales bacterium]|nr:YdeI/OmpD-associated family protein [Eubacteriales bacterium]
MDKMTANPKVDTYLAGLKNWRQELGTLREILLDAQLTEEMKWGKPCYTLQGGNVAILYAFHDTCAVGFFKGALFAQAEDALIKPGENSQAMRMMKFTSQSQILTRKAELTAFLAKAMEVEKAGLEVPFTQRAETMIPQEFQAHLAADPMLKAAFEALTPGRQRGYALYFMQPKQAVTREARIAKCVGRIISGKGLEDPYET